MLSECNFNINTQCPINYNYEQCPVSIIKKPDGSFTVITYENPFFKIGELMNVAWNKCYSYFTSTPKNKPTIENKKIKNETNINAKKEESTRNKGSKENIKSTINEVAKEVKIIPQKQKCTSRQLDYNLYMEKIQSAIKPTKSKTYLKTNSKKVVSAFLNEVMVKNTKEYPNFRDTVINSLQEIAQLEIGQTLLGDITEKASEINKIIKNSNEYNAFTIEPSNFGRSRYAINLNTIFLNLKKFELRNKFDNNNNELFLDTSVTISLAHELIHYLHCLNNCEIMVQNIRKKVNSDLENLEDELTITGTPYTSFYNKDCDKLNLELNENMFRVALGLQPAFTHLAYKTPEDIIEQDSYKLHPQKFAKHFKRYWKRLPENSSSKKELILRISKPSSNQISLIKEIEKLKIVRIKIIKY